MDEKETKSLGVCHRLFNFIMKILTLQPLRKAALGCLAGRVSSAALPSDAIHGKGGIKSDPMAQAKLGSGKTNVSSAALPSDAIHGKGGIKSDPMAQAKLESGKTNDTSKELDSSTSVSSLPQNDQVADDNESPPTKGSDDAVKAEEEASAQLRAPKKMVSINERVEDINKTMKERKKSKSFDRSNSLENGKDEPKPLKSILKVGSNRDENTEAYVNQNPS